MTKQPSYYILTLPVVHAFGAGMMALNVFTFCPSAPRWMRVKSSRCFGAN